MPVSNFLRSLSSRRQREHNCADIQDSRRSVRRVGGRRLHASTGHETRPNDHLHVERYRPRADYDGHEQRTCEALQGFVGADSDAFRVLDLFAATHLTETYEGEFAELDSQLGCGKVDGQMRDL